MKKIILGCVLALCSGTTLRAQPLEKPKLVVGIVVDQMRPDYIDRFYNRFGEGGFKRLISGGFSCADTRYNYVPTATAPGHASIYTGTTPSINGIIGNSWFNKKNGAVLYCVEDNTVTGVGLAKEIGKDGRMSPENLLVSTITDELQLATNGRSKVIGISIKDRGSILPAGRMGDGAYWFSGNDFITSTWYTDKLPDWVVRFNRDGKASKYAAQTWNTLYPIETYNQSLADDNEFEGRFGAEPSAVFPHDLRKWNAGGNAAIIKETPFGNSIVVDFALAALEAENLGKGTDTDFLCISFSSTDYVGHKYGPLSIELEDTYLRLDSDLERLLQALDAQVGAGNYLVFLTADHGAAQVPGQMLEMGIPAGYIENMSLIERCDSVLLARFGTGRELIRSFFYSDVYLNDSLIAAKELDVRDVERALTDALRGQDPVYDALSIEQCAALSHKAPYSLVVNGHHPGRSGTFQVIPQIGWMDKRSAGTSHGTPHIQDAHVPLLFYGKNVKPGVSYAPVAVEQIAPTLSHLLGVAYPNGTTALPIEDVLNAAR